MDVLLTVLGIVVIVAGLMDMFHTLLHPSGQGRLSRLVLSTVWKVSKATGHRAGGDGGRGAPLSGAASSGVGADLLPARPGRVHVLLRHRRGRLPGRGRGRLRLRGDAVDALSLIHI